MKKKILITGGNGQLGSAIKKAVPETGLFELTSIDIDDLNLTRETDVTKFFAQNTFNYIINCAAYTAVDQSEKEPEIAHAVNAVIPVLLNSVSESSGIRLIHISTDFVYDGNASLPHVENETPLPTSVYAKTKLDGEKALANNKNAIIMRTSWLYSEFGNNFMKTILKLVQERKELGIVFDQIGTPTYAGDLAKAILNIIDFSEKKAFMPGIYNYSNEGVCSWYDFATEIGKFKPNDCIIKPIRTHEYPLPAQRPAYSVMDKHKIKHTFGLTIPYWKDSLNIALHNYNNKTL